MPHLHLIGAGVQQDGVLVYELSTLLGLQSFTQHDVASHCGVTGTELQHDLLCDQHAASAHHVEVVAEQLYPAPLVLLGGLPAEVTRDPHVHHRLCRCLATLAGQHNRTLAVIFPGAFLSCKLDVGLRLVSVVGEYMCAGEPRRRTMMAVWMPSPVSGSMCPAASPMMSRWSSYDVLRPWLPRRSAAAFMRSICSTDHKPVTAAGASIREGHCLKQHMMLGQPVAAPWGWAPMLR